MELTTLGFDSAELGLLSPLGPLLRKVVECSAATDPVANSSLSTVSQASLQTPLRRERDGAKANNQQEKGEKRRERREKVAKGD